MAIHLDHTIVPAHDKEASARFFAEIFGLKYEGLMGHFAPVRRHTTRARDVENVEVLQRHHYACPSDDGEFEAMLQRVRAAEITIGSDPWNLDNGEINTRRGGRGFYFRDPNGHVLEVMTRRQTGA